jgi:hypothetical protein
MHGSNQDIPVTSDTPTYNAAFYNEKTQESLQSAQAIVPLVINLVNPHSVIDAGCGMAAWLSVFREHGVENILGLDGSYIDLTRLLIPSGCFRVTDLSKPYDLNEKYDLAMSVEVAEHLPSTSARDFVNSLCKLAPLVLFSAAIPGQGGTHHINEQWPEYWRQIFAEFNYRMFDPFRGLIWQNDQIAYYYRQNLFLFVRSDLVASDPVFRDLIEMKDHSNLNTLMLVSAPILDFHLNIGLTATLKKLPGLLRAAILRRLGR